MLRILNQRERLELFLTDARIPIHNNASERCLRVVALGRKNYLFFGHPRAGRNIAGLYSLVGMSPPSSEGPTSTGITGTRVPGAVRQKGARGQDHG